ncbi:MAG: hypothetical protein Q9M92_17125 [Enterobacterales bacterium]|nr:hypothetical protein [Enterobacterales bacterium]
MDNAIEWIATAKPPNDPKRAKVGAIDAVVEADQLKAVALQMINDAADGKLDWKTVVRSNKKSDQTE